MTQFATRDARWRAAIIFAVLIAGTGGYWIGTRGSKDAVVSAPGDKGKILYYYDPMFPAQKFAKPGKSPFMGMQLLPKYADEAGSGAAKGLTIDPSAMQNLGIRSAAVMQGRLDARVSVTGVVDFNQRNLAILQARSEGFVTRVYARAPGDVVRAGAPIVDFQMPQWGGAQAEFLAVRKLGRADLANAARQRLRLLGMSDGLIRSVERSGRTNGVITLTAPASGVIQTLDARVGASVMQGQTLAQISGIDTVWVNAAVPEAQAGTVHIAQRATITLNAFPGESFNGRVTAILPTTQVDSRTVTVRIELGNKNGRLRPGMFALVALDGDSLAALLVPSEAVIRTGTRNLVMIDKGDGRYHPAEVRIGREGNGRTEILAGLSLGEKVVASGQFLLDSEASLTGIEVRKLEQSQ